MNIYLKGRGNNYYAIAQWDGKKVIVKKGSKISEKLQSNYKFTKSIIEARNDKTLVNNKYNVLQDITFDSPSTAAQFVVGRSINGRKAWKNENKIYLTNLIDEV